MRDKPTVFNNLKRAWALARPIKTSFSEITELFVGVKDLRKKVNEAKNTILFSGGIYSIYSEKTKYGMGKSQFAYFLQKEYEKDSELGLTNYHSLSPSQDGFKRLEKELKECLIKCNKTDSFYFFIDEIDLISDPNLSEEDVAKRIEKFGNILIEVAEEAFNIEKQFHIFLILSKRIQDDFEKFVSHRIKRRITPFIAVDILFTEEDIEKLATRFFSMLWVSNHKNVKNKFKKYDYRFKEIIANMITDFINNLNYLGLHLKSSVIGDFVEKFRNIYDIILDGVSEAQIETINLSNESDVGIKVEGMFKEYLLSRNKPLLYEENGHQIKVMYIRDIKKIGKHETDGYYSFLIGDTQIGMMPVEITAQKDLKGRKKKQLKAFTEEYNTLLIWMFPDQKKVKEELKYIRERVLEHAPNDLYELIIPRDLIKYTLILESRKFSLLEELKSDIISDIHTYLTKYAKDRFNRWMMEKPISVEIKGEEEVKIAVIDTQEKVERLFENFFEFFVDKTRRTHGSLKSRLKKQIESLNKGLGLENDFLNIENIYREIIEKLENEELSRYKRPPTDKSYLSKQESFTVKEAINVCTPIITSRIEAKIKNM